ncbi:hypothetical protein [Paracoccus jeotgali]|uniref:hypothetical protein n=1 Tax=Paracoccus jeotgali TaxID=2065379 RepID=UPI0028A73627|nr:hypothetical protein [Paracoccus jeotgali]
MSDKPLSTQIMRPKGTWVQTDRAAHEAWAHFLSLPGATAASRVLHLLIADMGDRNRIVISQGALAKRLKVDPRTVRRAVALLRDHNWIGTSNIGGAKSGVQVYYVNSRLAWQGPRDGIRHSLFDAAVYVTEDEQEARIEDAPELHRIPSLYPGEGQLPAGPGLPPVSQPFLDDMEPDLPATRCPDDEP